MAKTSSEVIAEISSALNYVAQGCAAMVGLLRTVEDYRIANAREMWIDRETFSRPPAEAMASAVDPQFEERSGFPPPDPDKPWIHLTEADAPAPESEIVSQTDRIVAHLKAHGPLTAAALQEATGYPRRIYPSDLKKMASKHKLALDVQELNGKRVFQLHSVD